MISSNPFLQTKNPVCHANWYLMVDQTGHRLSEPEQVFVDEIRVLNAELQTAKSDRRYVRCSPLGKVKKNSWASAFRGAVVAPLKKRSGQALKHVEFEEDVE